MVVLEIGADNNTQKSHKSTTLQSAAFGESLEIVQLLLDKGADVCVLKAAAVDGNNEIVAKLLEKDAEVKTWGGARGLRRDHEA